MLLNTRALSFLPLSAKALDLSLSVPPRRFKKFKIFLISLNTFVAAGDFMAYRYNIHGSNALLSIVTCTEGEGPSISLFSNTFLSFTFYFIGPTKKDRYCNGFSGM